MSADTTAGFTLVRNQAKAEAPLGALQASGVVLSTILKAVWLGILGGPIGALAWLALLVGAGVFWWGFTTIRDARAKRL